MSSSGQETPPKGMGDVEANELKGANSLDDSEAADGGESSSNNAPPHMALGATMGEDRAKETSIDDERYAQAERASCQTSSAPADEISDSREAEGSIKNNCDSSPPTAYTDNAASSSVASGQLLAPKNGIASSSSSSGPSPQEVQALLLLHQARDTRAPAPSTSASSTSSLGNRVDLPPASLQPPSLRAPLLQQLQSTLLAQGAAEVRQAPQPQAAAPPSYASILEQLATSQAPQRPDSSSTQSTSALLDAYLRQRLSAYQPVTVQRPSPPLAPASPPSTLPASLVLQQLQPTSPGQGAAAAGGLQRSPPPPYASVLEQLVTATQATQRPDSALLDAYLRQQLLAGQQLTTAQRSSLETMLLQTVNHPGQLSSMAGLGQDEPRAPPTLPASLLHRLGLPAQASAASAASAYPLERLGLLAPAPAASAAPPSNLPLSSLSPQVHSQILQSLLHELPGQSLTTAYSAQLPQAQPSSAEAVLLLHQLISVQQREPRPPLSTLPASLQSQIGLLAQSGAGLPIGAAPSMSAPASQDQSQILERLIRDFATGDQHNSTSAQSANSVESLLQLFASSSSEVPRHQDASSAVASRPESQSISSASSTSSFMENIAAADLAARQQNQGVNKAKEKRWMAKYEELKLFRRDHGHCRVPHGYAANRKLSWWVMNQRAQYHLYKQGDRTWLTDDRVKLLNDINFDWSPITARSKR